MLAWLDAAPRDARLFLWVHYMEPHGPYTPADALRSLFDLAAFDAEQEVPLQPEGRNGGRGAIPFYQQRGAPRPADAGDARDYLRRYAAEVRALDAAASALLAALDARGLLARAAWVVTSDHGEALAGDHGYWFAHDTGVTRDQIRVPLLLVHPRSQAARVDAPVATVDVLPTLLSLLGVAVPPGLDGVSLLAAPPDGRVLFARSRRERMVRRGRFKLRVAGDRRVLHDLAADPDERSDLAARHPGVLAELDALLPDAGAPD